MDLDAFLTEWHDPCDTLLVHTSGSTGTPKPLRVEKRRMQASARITCSYLGLRHGDTALLCMPLDYIAGKMMVVRALTWGLRLVSVPPGGHPLATVTEPIDFAAMVPLQVWQSLQHPAERQRLEAIGQLIVGGGAISSPLADAIARLPNPVWSTYGMTETLSHIALRRLNGPERSEWYTPLPGVAIGLTPDGCLTVDAPAVCAEPIVTRDVAELRDGRFRILGRQDNVICSGGIKIQAEEVERLLQPHLSMPFLVTRAADDRLGQQVVLMLEGATDVEGAARLKKEALQVCHGVLPRYWMPRRVMTVEHLPLTATGKPARAEAERMAASVR